jgi:hypothetical protein
MSFGAETELRFLVIRETNGRLEAKVPLALDRVGCLLAGFLALVAVEF